MSESLRAKLLCGGVGGILGFGTGFIFFLVTLPPRGPFPLFLPAVFAGVFAVVAFIAAEQLFPVMREVVLGFLILGGGAYLLAPSCEMTTQGSNPAIQLTSSRTAFTFHND